MTLVDWSGPLTAPSPRQPRHVHGPGCPTDLEMRRLLAQLERASAWIVQAGGDARKVLAGDGSRH